MLKIVMEDMEPGEVAAMFQDGENAIILITSDRSYPDKERCEALNRLLAHVKAHPGVPAQPATITRLQVVQSRPDACPVFLPHLSQQVTSATG